MIEGSVGLEELLLDFIGYTLAGVSNRYLEKMWSSLHSLDLDKHTAFLRVLDRI